MPVWRFCFVETAYPGSGRENKSAINSDAWHTLGGRPDERLIGSQEHDGLLWDRDRARTTNARNKSTCKVPLSWNSTAGCIPTTYTIEEMDASFTRIQLLFRDPHLRNRVRGKVIYYAAVPQPWNIGCSDQFVQHIFGTCMPTHVRTSNPDRLARHHARRKSYPSRTLCDRFSIHLFAKDVHRLKFRHNTWKQLKNL